MIQALPLSSANPAKQIVAWLAELFAAIPGNWESISTALAVSIAAYLAITLVNRWRGTGADPSIWMQKESAAGTTSVMISGVYVTTFLLGAIAFFTWPLPVENTGVGVAMLLVVVFHYRLEKQEVTG